MISLAPMNRWTDEPMDRPLRIVYLLESTALSGGVQVVLRQAETLARRGHRVTVVSPEPAPSWYPLLRARFERSSFRDSPELLLAEIRVATFWTTVAPALTDARGPVFHLCQGYEGGFSFYADRRDSIERAYRAPTQKITVSAALAASLEALGLGPSENVGQAFDPAPFFPAPTAVQNGRPPTILVVGPFAADVKGIAIAFEGLALWRRQGGEFRVRRVSTEPPAAPEEESGIVDEYHRGLDPERMPFAYRASDLFLGPARPEEGFGLPVLEALASGLPCLLSDTTGHREIAQDAAWYFDDGDPASLAAALPLVLTRKARERARSVGPAQVSRFDPNRVAANLERVFFEALSGQRPRP
jgi:glycosyltransferase involved in cell wall biosynthesis